MQDPSMASDPTSAVFKGTVQRLDVVFALKHECELRAKNGRFSIHWYLLNVPQSRSFARKEVLKGTVVGGTKVEMRFLTMQTGERAELKRYHFEAKTEEEAARLVSLLSDACEAAAFIARPSPSTTSEAGPEPGSNQPNQRLPLLCVVNPMSGRKQGMAVMKQVCTIFQLAGIGVQVKVTDRRGHAKEMLMEADLDTVMGVVVVGGDGTTNEVISGVLENRVVTENGGVWPTRLPLGVIPCGTDGSLPKFVTKMDPLDAAHVILRSNNVRQMDLLRVQVGDDVSYSACGVGWGLPGQIALDSEGMRDKFGVYRYTASTISRVASLKPVKGTVKIVPANHNQQVAFACGAHCEHCAKFKKAPRAGPSGGMHPSPAGQAVSLPDSAPEEPSPSDAAPASPQPSSPSHTVARRGSHTVAGRAPATPSGATAPGGATDVGENAAPPSATLPPSSSPPNRSPFGAVAGEVPSNPVIEYSGEFLLVGLIKTGKDVTPYVHLSDGCFDVFLIRNIGMAGLAALSLKVATRQHLGDKDFIHLKAHSVEIVPETTSDSFNVDGEVAPGHTLQVTVLKRAVPIWSSNW